jgi:hypothetical protein
MNENDKLPDIDFDEKVYSALSKKLLPEIKFDEPKDLSYYFGTAVLAYLVVIGLICIVDSYSIRQYNKYLIEINHERSDLL